MLNALTRYGIPAMILIGIAAVLVALFSAMGQPGSKSGLERFAKGPLEKLEITMGRYRPSSQFENADGEMISLAAFEGKTIVLNMWFESCPPCKAEMPSLATLQRETESDGVEVVAVAVARKGMREANREALADWTEGELDFHFDYSMGILLDSAIKGRPAGMPTTIIYDRHGEEMARLAGEADWASAEALALVREIAAR